MDKIEDILKNIEPIIMNCRKKTKIPSWEIEDYMQEGMIIALEMYNEFSRNLPESEFNFYVYFKVKYSSFLIDTFRRTQAVKRKFDKLDYFELAITYDLFDHTQMVAENVMYTFLHEEITKILTPEELETFEALKRGEKVDRNKKYRLKKKIVDYILRFW
jgi:competence protein ComX